MIIIPDIHGRNFWKETVKEIKDEEIIFLGDYVDPYFLFEDVEPQEGLSTLSEVIAFKKAHPNNVTLLLGNHDLSYVSDYIVKCRHDDKNHDKIRKLILNNMDLFNIAHEKRIENKTYLFSHAGIIPIWLEQNEFAIGKIKAGHEAEELNKLFHSGNLYQALGDISAYRGGNQESGSCIWADIDEHFDYVQSPNAKIYFDVYQIFGHSLQLSGRPIITEYFACLDCRHAFRLNDRGALIKIIVQ